MKKKLKLYVNIYEGNKRGSSWETRKEADSVTIMGNVPKRTHVVVLTETKRIKVRK